MIIAAIVALAVLILLTIFQLALIAKAPLGEFAWGGQYKVLPKKLRASSVVSILLYAIFALFISLKAGLLNLSDNTTVITVGMWIFTVYFFLGIIVNVISRSKKERLVMAPVSAILAVCFLLVTVS